MGHQVCYDTFSTAVSKKRIYAEVNARAVEDGDYHSPLERIHFFEDRCFDRYEEAEQFIEERSRNAFYGQFAVMYRRDENFVPSKTLENLQKRQSDARKAYWDLQKAFHFANHKSATVGCQNCTSKIALKYLRTNKCPVCGEDLRPESTRNRIAALKAKLDNLVEQCEKKEKAERLKSIEKAETYWLVKTEFHV